MPFRVDLPMFRAGLTSVISPAEVSRAQDAAHAGAAPPAPAQLPAWQREHALDLADETRDEEKW